MSSNGATVDAALREHLQVELDVLADLEHAPRFQQRLQQRDRVRLADLVGNEPAAVEQVVRARAMAERRRSRPRSARPPARRRRARPAAGRATSSRCRTRRAPSRGRGRSRRRVRRGSARSGRWSGRPAPCASAARVLASSAGVAPSGAAGGAVRVAPARSRAPRRPRAPLRRCAPASRPGRRSAGRARSRRRRRR